MDLDLRVGTTDGPDPELCVVVDAASILTDVPRGAVHRGISTGLTLVVAPGDLSEAQLEAVLRRLPSDLRVEVLLCGPAGSPSPGVEVPGACSSVDPVETGGQHLDRSGWLDAATTQAGGEIVLVVSPGVAEDPAAVCRHLLGALELMWVNGADGLVIESTDADLRPGRPATAGASAGAGVGDRRVEHLGAGLGLGARRDGAVRLVVLRRWVARFLLGEIGRAIDPVAELSSRIRLLEMRLIVVRDTTG